MDDELRDEVVEECSKFGKVENCVVHMRPEKSGVRVFVEFFDKESTKEAYLDMSSRFFAERKIECDFYPEDSFQKKRFNLDSLNVWSISN